MYEIIKLLVQKQPATFISTKKHCNSRKYHLGKKEWKGKLAAQLAAKKIPNCVKNNQIHGWK